MQFKVCLLSFLLMYFNYVNIILGTGNSDTGEIPIDAAESQNGVQKSNGLSKTMKKRPVVDKQSNDKESKDLMTRLEIIELRQNDLMKLLRDNMQITKEIQTTMIENQQKMIKTQVELNDKINQLSVKPDTMENKLNELENRIESLANLRSVMLRQQATTSVLEHNIRDVKRAASLLAVTKIKLSDLPYTRQCGSNDEMGENGSYMDTCIQTRLEELYNDFNDVMDFHVMLMGGSGPHEGRVEIIYQGRHGTVCAYGWDSDEYDFYWGWNDANVVCRMLGYTDVQQVFQGGKFGNGTGEILLDEVKCAGDEGSLLACKHRGIGGDKDVHTYCDHDDDAGVRCKTG